MLAGVGVTLMRKWLLADFGLDVVELSPVGHGADVAAQVWKAATAASIPTKTLSMTKLFWMAARSVSSLATTSVFCRK